jgi:glycosyltransferase involved in cell wall biosynthesis
MKILFDLTATQPGKNIINHGGSEYAKAVFRKLVDTSPGSLSVFYNENMPLENSLAELLQKHSVKVLGTTDISSVCNFIVDNSINMFYTALPKNEYLPLFKMQSDNFKVAITIHGLRHLELPSDSCEWYYCNTLRSRIKYFYKRLFPFLYKDSILKYYRKLLGASEIITVSDHSKRSLLAFFPELNQEKISVYYSPLVNYYNGKGGDLPDDSYPVSKRRYFLILSGSIWSKNSYRAICAFDDIISQHPEFNDYKMLVSGMKKQIFNVKNPGSFIFTDYLERSTLENLFKNSLALVYPTLNEGFGYPPLEAMKYGVPVLASRVGPVCEVCGDTAYYFNPVNVSEIMDKLLFAISANDLFSANNLKIRRDRYLVIRDRQERDLNKMIRLLCRSREID